MVKKFEVIKRIQRTKLIQKTPKKIIKTKEIKTRLNLLKTKKKKEKDINNSNKDSNIKFKLFTKITNDSICSDENDSSFYVYESLLDNNIYIIYFSKNESIISYNLTKNIKIKEIKGIHDNGAHVLAIYQI